MAVAGGDLVSVLTYDDHRPITEDREQWSVPAVLRQRAHTHGDRVALEFPEDGERLTYAEVLDRAERDRGLPAGRRRARVTGC